MKVVKKALPDSTPVLVKRFKKRCVRLGALETSLCLDIEIDLMVNEFNLSPIEQVYLMALCTYRQFRGIPEEVKWKYSVNSQEEIGQYRVDFTVYAKDKKVVVELDGKEYHRRDSEQCRYEDARDQFFVDSGYEVMHFTGKEVYADPFRTVCKPISYVLGMDCDYLYSYVKTVSDSGDW